MYLNHFLHALKQAKQAYSVLKNGFSDFCSTAYGGINIYENF